SFSLIADILIVTPKTEFIEAYNLPKTTSLLGSRPLLAGTTYDKARELAKGWCPYAIEDDWHAWMADGGMKAPDKPDAAYLGFVKKWVERRGFAR
ncbi:MAG: RepA, partial [Pseudomonadota bacterium]